MKKHIPNILTLGNLLCGVLGILFIADPDINFPEKACYFLGAALIFDFLDGFVARLLGVSSPIGKELDSLADLVTFGVLPGFMLYHLFTFPAPTDIDNILIFTAESDNLFWYQYKAQYLSFLVPLFAALRLAKFNVDENQSDKFIGLPTPAAGIFIASLIILYYNDPFTYGFLTNPIVLIITSIAISLLMVAPIELIALKFKNYSFKDNTSRYILILSAIASIILLGYAAFPIIILLYLCLSIISKVVSGKGV